MRLVSRSVRALPGGQAEARVQYNYQDAQGPANSIILILERTAAGWKIADFIRSDGSYAASMRGSIAEMSRKNRRR
jgi:hypothetical protein